MKSLGYFVLAAGVIWLLVALNMDTSVETNYGRVNNIGLMASKQNHIIIGGFVAFCGLMMSIFGKSSQASISGTVKCPFCAEPINPEAIKCKHCGSEVTPSLDASSKPFPMHAIKPSDLYVRGPEGKNIVDTDGVKKIALLLHDITPNLNANKSFEANIRSINDIAMMYPKYLRETFISDLRAELERVKGAI